MGSRIEIVSYRVQDESLEELIEKYGRELGYPKDILCWKCLKNYEIHFTCRLRVIRQSEPLKCPECLKTFTCKTSVQIHMKDHILINPYECCICAVSFQNTSSLIKHMNKHKCDTSLKEFFKHICDTSHKEFSSESADDLEIAFSPRVEEKGTSVVNDPFGRESSNKEENRLHCLASDVSTVNHHFGSVFRRNSDEGEKLSSCKGVYDVAKQVTSFMQVDRYVTNVVGFLNDEISAIETVVQKLDYCTKLAGDMRENSQTPSDWTLGALEDLSDLEVVYKQVILSSYGSILADLDRSQFWCNFCAIPFKELEKFQMHKKVTCAANTDAVILTKLRNNAGDESQYKCFMCNKHFMNRLQRYDHMRVHFAGMLKRCPICTKHFELPSELKDHLLTHPVTKDCLFTCHKCNKCFSDMKTRSKHIQRVHRISRPYKCNTCGREFFKGSSFALHVKGHLRNKWRKSLVGMDMYKPHKQNLKKK